MINILKIYKTATIQLKATFWFLLSGIIQKGISTITVPIFTRIMSTSEYGRYGVFNSWYEIVSVFVSLNLSAGLFTQGIIKFKEKQKDFTASFQTLNLALFFFWIIMLIPFHSIFEKIMNVSTAEILLMVILAWINSAFSLWAAEQRVEYLYKALVIISIISAVLNASLGIIFTMNSSDKVLGRIIGVLISAILAYSIPALKQLLNGGSFFSVQFWKYALKYSIPLIPHYLSQIVLNSSDRIMIKNIIGESASGKYALVYSVALIMIIFNTALLNTIHPWVYQRINSKQTDDIKNVVYSAYFIVGLLNVILIAFAPEIIVFFAPSEYYEAIWALPPISMSIPFLFIYGLFADFEFYYDKAYLASIASVIGAILNIWLNKLFIPAYGYISAGYTTLFCYMFYALFHYCAMIYICDKKMNGKKPYELKILLLISISFLSVGFVFLISYLNTVIRYSVIIFLVTLALVFKRKIKNMIMVIARSKM